MGSIEYEVELSDEERTVQETVHRFAVEVMRPAGAALDAMVDAEDLDEVLRMEADGVIDICSSFTHRLPLDEVPEALEMLRTKRGDPERIVIEMES
jgi:threonine dehydrogenase-like Zn-dependent dehydrogenase